MTNKGTGIGIGIGIGIGRHHSGMTPREARKKDEGEASAGKHRGRADFSTAGLTKA
jgi:hypothetical protein